MAPSPMFCAHSGRTSFLESPLATPLLQPPRPENVIGWYGVVMAIDDWSGHRPAKSISQGPQGFAYLCEGGRTTVHHFIGVGR